MLPFLTVSAVNVQTCLNCYAYLSTINIQRDSDFTFHVIARNIYKHQFTSFMVFCLVPLSFWLAQQSLTASLFLAWLEPDKSFLCIGKRLS